MKIYLLYLEDGAIYFNSDGTYGCDNDTLIGVYDSYEEAEKVGKSFYGSFRVDEAKLNSLL